MTTGAEEKETGRVEAFSDGVFAIAITLLILEIKVPHLPGAGTARDLAVALAGQWPSYTAFVLSFVMILIMWVNHHAMFRLVHRVDAPFLYANGFLLLLVTFVPYPTAVLAEYLERSGAPVAGAFFAGTYAMLGIAFNLLWAAASRGGRLLKSGVSEATVGAFTRSYRLGPPLYLAAAAAAFVNVFVTIAICVALAIFWIVTGRSR